MATTGSGDTLASAGVIIQGITAGGHRLAQVNRQLTHELVSTTQLVESLRAELISAKSSGARADQLEATLRQRETEILSLRSRLVTQKPAVTPPLPAPSRYGQTPPGTWRDTPPALVDRTVSNPRTTHKSAASLPERDINAILAKYQVPSFPGRHAPSSRRSGRSEAMAGAGRLRPQVTLLSSVDGGVHKDGTSGYRRSGLETTDGKRSDAGGMHHWSTGKSLRTSELGERDGPLSHERLDADTEAVAVAFVARLEEDRTPRAALTHKPSDPYAHYPHETGKLIREMDKLLYPHKPNDLSAHYPPEIRELFRKMDEEAARSTQRSTIPGASRPHYSCRVSSRHALTPQAQGVTRRVEMVAISRYRLPMNATGTGNTGIHCEIDRKAINLTAVQLLTDSAMVVFKAASSTASLSSLLSDQSNPLPLLRVLFDQEEYTHGEAKYDFLNDRLVVHLT